MTPSCDPYRLNCTALRFPRTVSPEHPAVSLPALMESKLFFMFFPARIILRKMVSRTAPRQLSFYRAKFYR